MARSFTGWGKLGDMIGGSRSDHTIVGCRQHPDDPKKFLIMEANGNERGDGEGKEIATIANGADRSTICFVDGSRVQVIFATGVKRKI